MKTLLYCGVIGCPFFVLVFLIEGATRSDYNPLRYPVSSLSIGALGWIQISNFIITGALLLAFSFGMRLALRSFRGSVWGPLLIGLVAAGLIGAGIFSTDPVFGYPTQSPLALAQYTVHGHFHDAFSMLVFAGLPAACFVFRSRFVASGERDWAVYSAITGLTVLLTFVLASMGFKQMPGLVEYAGAFQRASIIVGWTWITLLAFSLLRSA